jgi:hypothetical protein
VLYLALFAVTILIVFRLVPWAVGLALIPIVLFSVRMVKSRGIKPWQFGIWTGILGLLGLAGYMEYFVQRNGHRAATAYSVMGASLLGVVILGLVIRTLTRKNPPTVENT